MLRLDPNRLVCIDATTAPPLNVFDFTTLDDDDAFNSFKFFLSSLAGGLSPKQETCLLPLFALLKATARPTLLTLHEIITERPKRVEQSRFTKRIVMLRPNIV